MKEKYGWYALLKNEAAYKRWVKKEGVRDGETPASYPCFATTTIDGYENHHNEYLYPAEIAAMHKECEKAATQND